MRVRAIVYYEDLNPEFINPSFLLFNRSSLDYPGWEFIKGGVKRNESLDQALIRELSEEACISKENFIEPLKAVKVKDAIAEDSVVTYLIRVTNPPPSITKSKEHYNYGWFDVQETINMLKNRPLNRLRDYFTFYRILEKEFPDLSLVVSDLGYL